MRTLGIGGHEDIGRQEEIETAGAFSKVMGISFVGSKRDRFRILLFLLSHSVKSRSTKVTNRKDWIHI